MELWQLALVLLAGAGAGFINAVVGTGTLITFPTLLALGLPPLVANMSNTVGLFPGGVSAVVSSRQDLVGQRSRVIRLAIASAIGGVIGAVLLLRLPPGVFQIAVPILIAIGCVLVLLSPKVSKAAAARRERPGAAADEPMKPAVAIAVWFAVLGAGIYGGYFGAAQGVIMMGVMGMAMTETLARLNVVKNLLVTLVNGIAAAIFIVIGPINWQVAITIAIGSVLGAALGARIGRKLPPTLYRVIIVTIGAIAIINEVRKLVAG
ncbi:sulfite exporter TauE/SafE family protein [Propionibacteriaceae bacterium Y1700]|uniref:sulfite exporter TauE/SafE family protein n=1 Tax=Microlunatus sp. Y1700 TaxID=3418487 RepID=UPI003DA6DDAC